MTSRNLVLTLGLVCLAGLVSSYPQAAWAQDRQLFMLVTDFSDRPILDIRPDEVDLQVVGAECTIKDMHLDAAPMKVALLVDNSDARRAVAQPAARRAERLPGRAASGARGGPVHHRRPGPPARGLHDRPRGAEGAGKRPLRRPQHRRHLYRRPRRDLGAALRRRRRLAGLRRAGLRRRRGQPQHAAGRVQPVRVRVADARRHGPRSPRVPRGAATCRRKCPRF